MPVVLQSHRAHRRRFIRLQVKGRQKTAAKRIALTRGPAAGVRRCARSGRRMLYREGATEEEEGPRFL